MKKLIIIATVAVIAILAIVVLKYAPGTAEMIWTISQGGSWLLPLVIFSSILDSVHPCSFSILLITIAFLFGLQMTRGKILQIGGLYIAGIFAAYFTIGIGLLQVIHIFNVPHFMGKLGAALLILFGLLNLLGAIFPKFPIKLKIPDVAHRSMGKLINSVSLPAAFALGLLVGLCQFPCMGGPYLMVIGLLHDQVTYFRGFGYLVLYNIILIVPLVATLWIAAQKTLIDKVKEWKTTNMKNVHLYAGIAMIIIGIAVLFI
ncbi:MAG: cytochrome c biogenesis protein CcdA [Candidatus Paceibacterota bacterium]|jgi:cytochrome c biogenesis protein CcdA